MNTSSIIKPLTQGLIILGLITLSAQARLGENTQQCDTRYGERLFKHKNGNLSYGVYNFSGKKIQAFFLDDKSVLEMINIGPFAAFSQEQNEAFVNSSTKFVRGLLAQAYGFNDEQLQGLAMKMISREVAEAKIENKTTRVVYRLETDEAKNTLSIRATVADIKAVENIEKFGFSKFVGESMTLEFKKSEADDADGF